MRDWRYAVVVVIVSLIGASSCYRRTDQAPTAGANPALAADAEDKTLETLPSVAEFLSRQFQSEVNKLRSASLTLSWIERKRAEAHGATGKAIDDMRLPIVEDTYSALNAEILKNLEKINEIIYEYQQEITSPSGQPGTEIQQPAEDAYAARY